MDNNYLIHYGIKGMKWGVRRARIKEAKSNYRKATDKAFATYEKRINSIEKGYKRGQNLSKADQVREAKAESDYNKATAKAKSDYKYAKQSIQQEYKDSGNTPEAKAARRKTAIKVGAVVAGTALAAYGAYKASEAIKNKAYKVNFERGQTASKKYMDKLKSERLPIIDSMIDTKHVDYADGMLKQLDTISKRLKDSDHDYAYRNSKKLAPAIKTLIGKNRELTTAELLNMGINIADRHKYL